MISRSVLLLATFFLVDLGFAGRAELSVKEQRQVEVSMRLIGHEVLLAVGDSSSRVLPVEKEGDQYKIRFGTEFGFNPDDLVARIDSVIHKTRVAKHYIVEFVSCDSNLVVHSWGITGTTDDMIPCGGRVQPLGCYELLVTVMEQDGSTTILDSALDPTDNDQEGSRDRSLIFLFLSLMALTGVVLILLKRRARKAPRLDSGLVQIGEFQFNERNMELFIANDRIRLTSKESNLLQILSESVNNTVEREYLLANVWGDQGDYVGRTLDVFISKLRKKLEADTNVRIVNIRGVGYKLVLGE